ncbi:class B sortase [Peptostreptococcus russellii]|uniref:class B sortase n=1 Tax=Peptostreptococcus russellii TaxID=215200 RepID=UPI00294241DD|nr:class B sortase [Peptostreptococcus russellii]
MNNLFKKVFSLIFLGIFIFSTFKIYTIIEIGKREENNFKEIRAEFEKNKGNSLENKKDYFINDSMARLFKKNKDFVAWININKTPIDYPVMSSPRDANYYLRKNFNKKYSVSGTFFIGDGLSPYEKSFVIYGHNMNNKTMMGTLDKYADKNYMLQHSYIDFTTLKDVRKYKIVTAFYGNVEKSDFKYYNYCGNLSREEFDEFVQKLSKVSLYGSVSDLGYEDDMMMLSTCSEDSGPKRFVVVAKRIS